MSSIPEVRKRLLQLAKEHKLPELSELAEKLKREPPVRRAPASSASMTPELCEQIREYAEGHPFESLSFIANKFGVNPGRVSEILSRKYDA